jgi:hypothetical protein
MDQQEFVHMVLSCIEPDLDDYGASNECIPSVTTLKAEELMWGWETYFIDGALAFGVTFLKLAIV